MMPDAQHGASPSLFLTCAAARFAANDEKLLAREIRKRTPYSWDNLVADGLTSWTGVRNFTARNNLRAMSRGRRSFLLPQCHRESSRRDCHRQAHRLPDSTATDGDWSAVDLVPKRKLARPVTLADIRRNRALKDIPLLRQSRLSVQPLRKEDFDRIVQMAEN